MKRFIDILKNSKLDEYQKVEPLPWKAVPPLPEGASHEGQVSCAAGVVDVYYSDVENEEGFAHVVGVWGCLRVDTWTKTEKPIAFISLAQIPRHVVFHQAFVLPEFQGQGVLSEMVNHIVRVKNISVINDAQVSKDGEKVMQYLNRKYKTSILYLPTGETFSVNDVGSAVTTDGVAVASPEKDCLSQWFYSEQNPFGQRFFYLWESIGNFTNIIEGVTYTYGCNSAYHRSRYSIPPRYFYDDAP